MAKYVLVAFGDDEDADAFVKSLDKGTVFYTDKDGGYNYIPTEKAFVRGTWKKPTLFCAGSSCTGKGGFARSVKYGWWVCTVCKKPREEWALGDAWYTALGTNLLPTSEKAPEWRGKGIRGHVFSEERKEWINVTTGKPWNPTEYKG